VLSLSHLAWWMAYAVVKVLSQQAGIRNFAVSSIPWSTRCGAGHVPETVHCHWPISYRQTAPPRLRAARRERASRSHGTEAVVDLFPMAPASRAIVDVATRLFSEPAPQILEGA